MSSPEESHFTEPTTTYWQELLPATTQQRKPPYQYSVPISLPDHHILELPIRPLSNNPTEAVASLLINQAAFTVTTALSTHLSDLLHPYQPEIIIGLPTLGYSRKFWYLDSLSTSVSSITSPGVGEKRVYLDPHLLPLLKGKRIAIIDDAVSSGTTLSAVWDLLEPLCNVSICGVAMKQGRKWEAVLGEERTKKVVSVFDSPLLKAVGGGWVIRE